MEQAEKLKIVGQLELLYSNMENYIKTLPIPDQMKSESITYMYTGFMWAREGILRTLVVPATPEKQSKEAKKKKGKK